MKFVLSFLCLLIAFQSCKLAGVEKRRYRHGFFVQTRTQKQKPKVEEVTETLGKKEETSPDIVRVEKAEQAEERSIVASNLPTDRRNINRFNPSRTTFVNEHLRKSDQKKFPGKRDNAKSSGSDELIFRLFLIVVLLVFLAVAYGLKILIPTMTLGLCYGISAGIVLTLLFLLFFSVKKSG